MRLTYESIEFDFQPQWFDNDRGGSIMCMMYFLVMVMVWLALTGSGGVGAGMSIISVSCLLNVPVNNYSVMSRRSNRFLGITNIFGR